MSILFSKLSLVKSLLFDNNRRNTCILGDRNNFHTAAYFFHKNHGDLASCMFEHLHAKPMQIDSHDYDRKCQWHK